MPLSITTQSCLGSIAVGYAMQLPNDQDLVPLILVAFITMGANALAIAQAPIKLVIGSFLLSVVTSIVITIYSLALAA